MLLEIKGMARSTFYYHLKALSKADKYEAVKVRICEIFNESKGRYGYRRVTMQLRNEGFSINHKTVERLMSERGLKCRIRKKRYRSYKGTIGKIAPNILNRDFKADGPCQKLVTDVSQISIGAQKSSCPPFWTCSTVRCYVMISQTGPIWSSEVNPKSWTQNFWGSLSLSIIYYQ